MPPDPSELTRKATASFEAGDSHGAALALAAALQLAPHDGVIATNLGHAWLGAGDYERAQEAYARATALSPSLPDAWAGLGHARRRSGDPSGAIAAYRRALELGGEDAATLNGLGIALKDDGRLEDAERAYRRALELSPSAAIWVNLGNALGDRAARAEAIAAYETALSIDGGSAAALLNLFAAVYDDDPERGERCLVSAVAASPSHAAARFHLGALLALSGRADEAGALLDGAPAHLSSSLAYARDHIVGSSESKPPRPRPRLFTDGFRLLESALGAATVDGMMVELGVRRGTSINFIAARADGRVVHGFDSFEGLPTEWRGLPTGAYTTGGRLPVVAPNVELHAGWFRDTLPPFVAQNPGPVRFMNVDCDLYASAREALDAFAPGLVDGTVIVFDEYLANPCWEDEEHRALVEAARAHGFDFDYVSFSLFSRQAAIIVRRAGR